MVNKKIGGPQGVEKFVTDNQATIDQRLAKSPGKILQAWEAMKRIVKQGSKKCIEFCKKHWKAIVIILIVVAVIAFLLYKFGGAGTEQVASSETVQNSATEITKGADEIAGKASEVINNNPVVTGPRTMKELNSALGRMMSNKNIGNSIRGMADNGYSQDEITNMMMRKLLP